MLDSNTLVDIIALIIASIGLVGGIPKILEYLRPKPQLRINDIKFQKKDTGPTDNLVVEIENKECARPAMATNVCCLYVISKDDGTQLADNYDRTSLIGHLAPGKKKRKLLACQKVKHFHVDTVDVFVKVDCDEKVSTSRTFKNVDLTSD